MYMYVWKRLMGPVAVLFFVSYMYSERIRLSEPVQLRLCTFIHTCTCPNMYTNLIFFLNVVFLTVPIYSYMY